MTTIDRFYALTFWRPWPSAILYSGKDCENRTRPPPRFLLGKRIALHAGKTYQAHGGAWPGLVDPPAKKDCPEGVVGTAMIAGWIDQRSEQDVCVSLPGYEERVRHLDLSDWYAGPVGILLVDVVKLAEPIVVLGQRGWWPLPTAIADAVRGSVCPDKSAAAG